MSEKTTVEVQVAWLARLVEIAEVIQPTTSDPNLAHLLGYIDSARSMITTPNPGER